jgi:predicted dehydrogenase
MRIGLIGTESDHATEFLRLLNRELRHMNYRVTAIWGADTPRTAELARLYDVDQMMAVPDKMLGQVDAVIVVDRHGDDHLPHALPFLEAGLPVFVDKPLSRSAADAEAMLDAADKSGALLTSASALRWQQTTDELVAGVRRLGMPDRIVATGSFYPDSEYGGVTFYGIHAAELALQLSGANVNDVTVEKADAYEVRLAMWAKSTEVVIRLLQPLPGEGSSFSAEVFKGDHSIARRIILPDNYMAPVLDRFVRMIETGKAPLSRQELLAPVQLMELAQTALDESRRRSDRRRA